MCDHEKEHKEEFIKQALLNQGLTLEAAQKAASKYVRDLGLGLVHVASHQRGIPMMLACPTTLKEKAEGCSPMELAALVNFSLVTFTALYNTLREQHGDPDEALAGVMSRATDRLMELNLVVYDDQVPGLA